MESASPVAAAVPRNLFVARHLAMLEELILAVARGAGLTPEQAALAVAAALRFFTARLPSSLVGELHARLGSGKQPPPTP